MKFINLPFPYSDFCVVHTCKENYKNIESKLRIISNELGSNFKVYKHKDKFLTIILYFDSSNIDYDEDRFSLLSGLAIGNQKLLLKTNEYLLEDYEKLDKDFGQFTALFVDGAGVSYQTDNFGSGHLYYYENKKKYFNIVSNRSHFIKLIIDKLMIPVTLNKSLVKGMFFSDYHFFTQQSFLSNGLINEIKLLRLDEELVQKSGAIIINKNLNIMGMFNYSDGDYSSLLNDFCDKSINDLNVVLSNDFFSQYILDLSGGKDSRLCLALLLNTEYSDKISIMTNDVPRSDDLAISAGITNLLGLSYITKWNSKLYPNSIDEGMNLWRSYFFGEYHRVGFAAWTPKGKNLKDIRISGASGGIYRSTWSTSSPFYKGLNKYKELKDVLFYVVNDVAVSGRYQKEDLDEIIEHLYVEINSLPGSSIADKIDNHYLFHRNRSHFGLRGFSFYNECLTLTPLLSIQLFKASRLLEYNERQNYKIFYDLYNKLAPFLLNIRFDGETQTFGSLFSHENKMSKSITFDLNENLSKWESSQKLLSINKRNSCVGKAKMKWSDYLLNLRAQSLEMKNEIDKLYPLLVPADLTDKLFDEKNPRNISVLYSQLSSIIDSH